MERQIAALVGGHVVRDGAGVRLRRLFAHAEAPRFDPFLLFDDFGSRNAKDYIAGFPWHPHRGIETVTYMLHGVVEHGDSIGNRGEIRDGQIQWMTAGSGIIHQEMPRKQRDYLRGFQLWVNLPAKDKMVDPRYRDVRTEDIPVWLGENGTAVKVISGRFRGFAGPARDIIGDPEYLDVDLPAGLEFEHDIPANRTVFLYAFEGEGMCPVDGKWIPTDTLALFGGGTGIRVRAGDGGFRFVLISGTPIGEPVAWGGPIVMNSQAELDLAFREYKNGTFIKKGRKPA